VRAKTRDANAKTHDSRAKTAESATLLRDKCGWWTARQLDRHTEQSFSFAPKSAVIARESCEIVRVECGFAPKS
jgi:hypothetical protein